MDASLSGNCQDLEELTFCCFQLLAVPKLIICICVSMCIENKPSQMFLLLP